MDKYELMRLSLERTRDNLLEQRNREVAREGRDGWSRGFSYGLSAAIADIDAVLRAS